MNYFIAGLIAMIFLQAIKLHMYMTEVNKLRDENRLLNAMVWRHDR